MECGKKEKHLWRKKMAIYFYIFVKKMSWTYPCRNQEWSSGQRKLPYPTAELVADHISHLKKKYCKQFYHGVFCWELIKGLESQKDCRLLERSFCIEIQDISCIPLDYLVSITPCCGEQSPHQIGMRIVKKMWNRFVIHHLKGTYTLKQRWLKRTLLHASYSDSQYHYC